MGFLILGVLLQWDPTAKHGVDICISSGICTSSVTANGLRICSRGQDQADLYCSVLPNGREISLPSHRGLVPSP